MSSRRVRVMVLVDTLQAGGAERVAVDLASALDPRAFEPYVVVTKRGGPLEEQLAEAGVPYVVLWRRRLLSLRPFLRALRIARRTDLIHSHLFGNNVWGAVLARLARVPLVAHEHNRVARVRFESLLDRALIAPAAARVLCVSDASAGQLVGAGHARSRVEVVPNGVRLERALPRAEARARLGLPDEAVVIGAVASLRPEKGHDVLLHAFASLVRDRGAPLRLCLVGDGWCREELEALAAALGISQSVDFAGARSDAPCLQSAFDVSVLPSRSEGLPLAALEALAAGTPLVATRVGALPELLADGAGLLVEPNDARGLTDALTLVLDDPGLARRLAADGARRAAERHDLMHTTARVEDVYRSVLPPRFREPDLGAQDVSVRRAESVV